MRLQDRPAPAAPHLSPLSITDCWGLRQAGYEPVGLAAATVVYYARPGSATARTLGRRGRSAPLNQELPDFSAATTNARDVCQVRMEEQAKRQGGTGLIGVSLELRHSIGFRLRAEGAGSRKQRYANLHLVVHGLGSTIRPVPGARGNHPNTLGVVWLR